MNQNLTGSSQELLLWYWQLGHANMQWIQRLLAAELHDSIRDGQRPILVRKNKTISLVARLHSVQPASLLSSTNNQQTPQKRLLCHKRTCIWVPMRFLPRNCISIDQHMLSLPGRLPYTLGKEKKDRYCSGTLFVDHVHHTGHVHLHYQMTLCIKREFEHMSDTLGVKIKRW